MSRKPSTINHTTLFALRKVIREKVSLQCNTSPEIQQLQSRIKKEQDENLSIQTLNRFFGLIKNDFKPSATTLNILARFVGYTSLEEFERFKQLRDSDKEIADTLPNIIKVLFSKVEADALNEKGLLSITRNLVELLDKHEELASGLYPFLASSEFGRRYFFEQYVNIDALNRHYGEGLYYYQLNTQDEEQRLFACTLLCLRYFLTNQEESFVHQYNKLPVYTYDQVSHYHPFLIGRYYATKVFYCVLHEQPLTIAAEAVAVVGPLTCEHDRFNGFPAAQLVLAEALILGAAYDEAFEVLQQGRQLYPNRRTNIDKGYWVQYDLLLLYAGYFSGVLSSRIATEQLLQLLDKAFFFLAQDFYSIFLNELAGILLPKSTGRTARLQVQLLVAKTGFVCFQRNNATAVPKGFLMEKKGKKIAAKG